MSETTIIININNKEPKQNNKKRVKAKTLNKNIFIYDNDI